MTLVTMMGVTRGQECVIRERDVISSDYDWPLSDCPCYHHSSANYSCLAPASSRDIVASPLVPCKFLPRQFLQCAEPHDHKGNETTYNKMGHGCLKYGGQRWEEVEKSKACCRVLDCIECSGPRTFLRDGFPCIRYTNHYFVTTLLYSILLGFLGLDRCYCVQNYKFFKCLFLSRFCLGLTGTGVGKLLTLGGLGIWWVVDIFLLVTGHITPDDDSNWIPLV